MSMFRLFTRAPTSLLLRPFARSFSLSNKIFEEAALRSKILYVGGLNFDTSRSALQEAFQEFGLVKSTRIITDRATGRSKGFGYIEYDSEDIAQKALEELHGTTLDGFNIRLDYALPRDDSLTGREPKEPSATIYFGNIPTDIDSTELQELLNQNLGTDHGIEQIRLLPGRSDGDLITPTTNRGFAFIEMASIDSAKKLVATIQAKIAEGWTIQEQTPRVDYENKGPRENRGGGGGRNDARRSFGDRPPRRDFGDRPPRRDFGASQFGGDRPPRRDFNDRGSGGGFGGDRFGGDRPPRRDFGGDRPARRPFRD